MQQTENKDLRKRRKVFHQYIRALRKLVVEMETKLRDEDQAA